MPTTEYKKRFLREHGVRRLFIPIFNRASYSRMMALIDELEDSEEFDIDLFLSSKLLCNEYGRGENYIRQNHKKAKIYSAEIDQPGYSYHDMCMASADIVKKVSSHLSENRYDAAIIVADRFETLPAAMAISYHHIPMVHFQGGECTGNIDDKIRHAVTKLSDFHFVSTKLSKEYLHEMGEHPSSVFNFGCPSLEVIHRKKMKRHRRKERYIICIFHPETDNVDEAFDQTRLVLEAIVQFSRQKDLKCYWFWPNPDPGRQIITSFLEEAHKIYSDCLEKAINEEPEDFLRKLGGCKLIIGNSSTGIREASFFGVPAINIGSRQGLRERAINVIDTGFDQNEILEALSRQIDIFTYMSAKLYGTGKSSFKIVKQLKRLEFKLKGAFTYPYWLKFRDEHFGQWRFKHHVGRQNRTE